MSTQHANPLAFPVPSGGALHDGMTLRDYFAGQALQGLSSKDGCPDPDYETRMAYRYADAMLKAREA